MYVIKMNASNYKIKFKTKKGVNKFFLIFRIFFLVDILEDNQIKYYRNIPWNIYH